MKNSITSKELNKQLNSSTPPLVFDVRKKPAYESDPRMLPSSEWRSHDEVEQWAKELSQHTQVIVYCVHGHEVSQSAAKTLHETGFEASYLEGGVAQWIEDGFEVVS